MRIIWNSKIYSRRKKAKDLQYLTEKDIVSTSRGCCLIRSMAKLPTLLTCLAHHYEFRPGPQLRRPPITCSLYPTETSLTFGIAFIWNFYNVGTNCWPFDNLRVVIMVSFWRKKIWYFITKVLWYSRFKEHMCLDSVSS